MFSRRDFFTATKCRTANIGWGASARARLPPPPAIKMAADRAPHDELPIALDDAAPGGTCVKLCILHCRSGGCGRLYGSCVSGKGVCTLVANETQSTGQSQPHQFHSHEFPPLKDARFSQGCIGSNWNWIVAVSRGTSFEFLD
jgi:hypothetical protein